MLTTSDAPRTDAAATASAVSRLSCPGRAAMTGTRRRKLSKPISSGKASRADRARRCSSSGRPASALDSAPSEGRDTARLSLQYQEPVVNTSPFAAASTSDGTDAGMRSARTAKSRASSTTTILRKRCQPWARSGSPATASSAARRYAPDRRSSATASRTASGSLERTGPERGDVSFPASATAARTRATTVASSSVRVATAQPYPGARRR